MKKTAVLIFISLLLASCGSHPSYSDYESVRLEGSRTLPYQLATAKRTSQKLLLILKDDPDSLKIKESALEEYFSQHNYHILIPGKAGKNEYEQQLLDGKEERLHDLHALLRKQDSLRKEELLIIGFGEGAYLVPELAMLSTADASFAINAGPFSSLHELDLLSQDQPQPAALKTEFELMRINSAEDFRASLSGLLTEGRSERVFHNHSNQYYLSYYRQPVYPFLKHLKVPLYWINSQQAPLITASSRELLRISALSNPYLYYKEIAGRGNFGQAGEMARLLELLDSLIKKQQSY